MLGKEIEQVNLVMQHCQGECQGRMHARMLQIVTVARDIENLNMRYPNMSQLGCKSTRHWQSLQLESPAPGPRGKVPADAYVLYQLLQYNALRLCSDLGVFYDEAYH
jgi:hypothetical protein